jgi:hypothetical protein
MIPNYTGTGKCEQMYEYKHEANGPDKLRCHKQRNYVDITDTPVPLNHNLQTAYARKINM